ncbi:MAG: ImmA/IrrE family metallo-endopeptidase [Enterocloster asparagiformis]|nr:ImmA/IrrE family metallo-endopeptidase [Enterocloster asparagiformis]
MQISYPSRGISFEEYNKIVETILMIYKECGVTSFPFDCFSILKHYNFRVYSYSELKEQNPELFHLCCSYSNDSFKLHDLIGYNERAYVKRIKFSLMHELGHAILNTTSEDIANFFASYILAPRILVHKYNCRTADAIHDFFGVSITAANNIILDYRDWFDFISHTTRKPLLAEQKLADMFFPMAHQKLTPVKTGRGPKKKRLTKRQREMDERAAFFQEQRLIYGEEYVFHMLEDQWIYGNSF